MTKQDTQGPHALQMRPSYVKFWQSGNHAIELYSEKFVWEKINYIHNNPVRENFVLKPEHWRYSSASNYIDGEGVLEEVFCLPPIQRTVS